MCHVPFTPSTACRETETAMRDLANAWRARKLVTTNPVLMAALSARLFRLATRPLGYLDGYLDF